MTVRRIVFLMVLLVFALSTVAAAMPLTIITFDEVPVGTNIAGLNIKGATFAYREGGMGPATIETGPTSASVDAAAISGGAEACSALIITFDKPTTLFEFGVALNGDAAWLGNDAYVRLYQPGSDKLRLNSRLQLDTSLNPWGLPEGHFSYSGPAIQRVEISFFDKGPLGCIGDWPGVHRFYIDNITFHGKPAIRSEGEG